MGLQGHPPFLWYSFCRKGTDVAGVEGRLFQGLLKSLTLPIAWKVLETSYEVGQPVPFRADSCLLRIWVQPDSNVHSGTKVLRVEHAPASLEGLVAQGLLGPSQRC